MTVFVCIETELFKLYLPNNFRIFLWLILDMCVMLGRHVGLLSKIFFTVWTVILQKYNGRVKIK